MDRSLNPPSRKPLSAPVAPETTAPVAQPSLDPVLAGLIARELIEHSAQFESGPAAALPNPQRALGMLAPLEELTRKQLRSAAATCRPASATAAKPASRPAPATEPRVFRDSSSQLGQTLSNPEIVEALLALQKSRK